jgi:hypothetical protein
MNLLRFHFWRRVALGLLLAMVSGTPGLKAQALSEAQVKAGFLFNFAKYVEWPVEAFHSKEAPVWLCVAGRDPFGPAIDAFDGKQVHGRPIVVRRIPSGSEDFRGCHVLYVSDSEQRHVAPLLRSAQGSILTVSDIDGFVDVGGAIGLVNADERIQFEVNVSTLQRASLKASSQLLKLARNASSVRGRN